jgi:hypothetical protein
MENSDDKGNYGEAKRKAKEFYRKIGRIWCPALYDYVSFTRAGFQHLIRRKKIQRPKSEQERRFSFLFYAETVVQNPKAIISYKKKSIGYTQAELWIFKQKINDVFITLVARRIGKGKIHFFSIYGKTKIYH